MALNTKRLQSRGYPNTQIRVSLFWAKLTISHFRSLSQTVLRVVSSYLYVSPKFIALIHRHLWSLDLGSSLWTKEMPFPERAEIHRALHLEGSTFFIDWTLHSHFESVLLTNTRPAVFAASQRRHYCLAYDSVTRRVLRFGGKMQTSNYRGGVEKSADAGSLNTRSWTALGNMHSHRAHIWPCWHCGVLYLCGGLCTTVETFDPVTDEFKLIIEFELPDMTPGVVISRRCELLLYFYTEVTVWNSEEKTVRGRGEFGGEVFLTQFAPVVYEGRLYRYEKRSKHCTMLDLETGREERGEVNVG